MAIEATLVCDFCSTVLAAESTATKVRRIASHLYRRVRGRDMCNQCCNRNGYKPRRQPDHQPNPRAET
jgi:hypothetical protein